MRQRRQKIFAATTFALRHHSLTRLLARSHTPTGVALIERRRLDAGPDAVSQPPPTPPSPGRTIRDLFTAETKEFRLLRRVLNINYASNSKYTPGRLHTRTHTRKHTCHSIGEHMLPELETHTTGFFNGGPDPQRDNRMRTAKHFGCASAGFGL